MLLLQRARRVFGLALMDVGKMWLRSKTALEQFRGSFLPIIRVNQR